MPKCIYMGMFCYCVKLMKNEVVVVELWMVSWLIVVVVVVVVVVLGCIVVELMHSVFMLVDWWCELLLLLLKVWWNLVELLNYDEMMLWFQVLGIFRCLLMYKDL